MPVQRRSIDIGTVLGTSIPQSSRTSSFPPPPGFSEGEDVMRKKRKRGEEDGDKDEEQPKLPSTEPLKAKSPSKKSKSKSNRALQKAAGHVSHRRKHRNNEPQIQWSCALSIDGRPINEDDSVIKGNNAR